MLDPDTFLTTLYVLIDDYCKQLPTDASFGPAASLSRSEVVTLAAFGQWGHFRSERAFYRYARHHLRAAFPRLPDRSQFNRLLRRQADTIVACCGALQAVLERVALFEAVDSTGVRTRNAKRRGCGWLPGQADIGWSNRLGWYEGFHVLLACTPDGVLTGFCFGPASTKDQLLAETFFAVRHRPDPRLPSAGTPTSTLYLTDTGFEGRDCQRRWQQAYGATVLSQPHRRRFPQLAGTRRWLAGLRQIVETVSEKLHDSFRLDVERPHALPGFQARLAAMALLHNFCIWLNRQAGRPSLAFADLIDW
jgi:hypothetical protein